MKDKKIKIRNGLILIYTGDGKGKTSAALGAVIRAAGYHLQSIMIQFIKGSWYYGEKDGALLLSDFFAIEQMGKGFYKIVDDNLPEEEHKKAAAAGIARAIEVLQSEKFDIVILDEINVALDTGLVSLGDVRRVLDAKPKSCHLILTGRSAHPEVIERADLVTEMREVKHPYQKGLFAQKGIDF
jgi:cob(I)alamin adenosyltransferase